MLGLVAMVHPAQAWMSGENFKDICDPPENSELAGITLGYVLGVIDAMEIAAAPSPLDATRRVRFCIPEHIKNKQIMELVCQYTMRQPAGHLPPYAVGTINVALQKTFPCAQ